MNSEEIIAEDNALENFFDKYIITLGDIAEAQSEVINGQYLLLLTVSSPFD